MKSEIKTSLGDISSKVLPASEVPVPEKTFLVLDNVSFMYFGEERRGDIRAVNHVDNKATVWFYFREELAVINVTFPFSELTHVPENKIVMEMGRTPDLDMYEKIMSTEGEPWIQEVENYCQELSISPLILIQEHAAMKLKIAGKRKEKIPFNRATFVKNKTIGQ